MGPVIGILNVPAALGLLDTGGHGGGDLVGIHDHPALGITGGTAYGLDQAGLAAEEALLVRIQNGHQRDLRQIQALTQQVDAHQHVKFRHAQVTQNLRSL